MIPFRRSGKFGSATPPKFLFVNSGCRQRYGPNGMDRYYALRYRLCFVGMVDRKTNAAASIGNRFFAGPVAVDCRR
jgi:hypothetical protein